MRLQVTEDKWVVVGEKCRESCKMWKADLKKADAYWKKKPEKKATEEGYMQKETKTTKWLKEKMRKKQENISSVTCPTAKNCREKSSCGPWRRL